MDLSTTYLGLPLRSPLVVGAAAPLSEAIDQLKYIEDVGAGAIILHSLFEEQLQQEQWALHHHLEAATESFAEALTYFPEPSIFHIGSELYLEHIRTAKEQLQIPIIASLNGATPGGWTAYAKAIAEAGADALELNIYSIPTDPDRTAAAIEQTYLEIVAAVRRSIDIPIAIKLSPYFTNLANLAKQLSQAGVNGLVLFNRFYQPEIDIEALEVRANLILSSPQDMRLPLRWLAILYDRCGLDLAASSGIQRGVDVVQMLMAGAQVTMLVGALLRHGIGHLHQVEAELKQWMETNEYESVRQLQGIMSQRSCPNPSEFERVQYMKAIQTYHMKAIQTYHAPPQKDVIHS
jgi:dihydroorotate dehydrogenase (fumarate)